jgi:hypothetical protein
MVHRHCSGDLSAREPALGGWNLVVACGTTIEFPMLNRTNGLTKTQKRANGTPPTGESEKFCQSVYGTDVCSSLAELVFRFTSLHGNL